MNTTTQGRGEGMKSAKVNGVSLDYEVLGRGEPVLLISPVLPDGFLPLLSETPLAERYQLIRYHKRGWVGSTHTAGPVSVADHAADAAALLRYLDIPRAHIAGHSTGGAAALQLALDHPSAVHTLCLLEPTLLSVPSGAAFLQSAQPVFEAYKAGRHDEAFAFFMSAVSGLEWDACRALLEKRVPGIVAQAVNDADTFFGIELPGVAQWAFGADDAARVQAPTLSVLGAQTGQLWVEVADRLRAWLPKVETCTIDGVGHLLHIQRPTPVAKSIADFFGRNPMARARDAGAERSTARHA